MFVVRDRRSVCRLRRDERISVFSDGRVVLRFPGVIEKRRIERVVENGSTKEYVLSEPFEVIRLEEVRDAECKG